MPTSLAGASPALAGFLSGVREMTRSRVVTLRTLRVLPLCERTLAAHRLQEAGAAFAVDPTDENREWLSVSFDRWAWWDDTVTAYDRMIAQERGRV